MEILINDEKIDYTLENEKHLNDVLKSIEEWVIKNGWIISAISADNEPVTLGASAEVLKKNVDGISLLKIQMQVPAEYALRTLETIDRYILDLKRRYLQAFRIEYHDAVLEGLELIENGLTGGCNLLHIKSFLVLDKDGRSLRYMLDDLRAAIQKHKKRYIVQNDAVDLVRILDALRGVLPKIAIWAVVKHNIVTHNTVKNPIAADDEEWKDFFLSALDDLQSVGRGALKKFEEIGADIQIGSDAPALNGIMFLTDILDEIVCILGLFMKIQNKRTEEIVSNTQIQKIIKAVSGSLKEIEESFKNGDMVSVGDLIEYELKSLYEDVLKLVEKISASI